MSKYNFDWNIIQECRNQRKQQSENRRKAYKKSEENKAYMHKYYIQVLKPKRQKAREINEQEL